MIFVTHDEWNFLVQQILALRRDVAKLSKQMEKEAMSVKDDVDALVAEVSNQTTVANSVVTLLNQLTAMVAAAAANTTDPATAAALTEAVGAIKANDAAIAAAVTANTPTPPAA